MIQKRKFIIRHKDGYFIDLHYRKATDVSTAARFSGQEDAEHFYARGLYRAQDPENYEVCSIIISYVVEVQPDVQEERLDQEHSNCAG